MRLYFCLLLVLCGHFSLNAAESLTLEFKVRSMYYDDNDNDANPGSYAGTATNGVPNKTRANSAEAALGAEYHYYFGWLDTKQPKGAVSAIAWIEDKNGKFIKVLGRWVGGLGCRPWKGYYSPGFNINASGKYLVHGDLAGRIYDMNRYAGKYGMPAGTDISSQPLRYTNPGNSKQYHNITGASPFDGEITDYDAVLGPTIGTKINGTTYLNPDDPATSAEDASLLTTVQTIPTRAAGNQPQAWDMVLEWNPATDTTGATALPPGDYNIIIECVEWAMEGEYNGVLVTTTNINTQNSIDFLRHKDHFKVMGYTYDGSSWSLRPGYNENDYYPTDSMRREGINTDQYTNPFTGNVLTRGSNEPAIIYDINVNYTPPAVNAAPVASISNPSSNQVVLQGATVNLQGSATDAEDGGLSGTSLQWSSNQDGSIGSGGTRNVSNLSVNTHTITLTATDSGGKTGTDTVQLTVHRPPTANISTASQTINSGSSITFNGSANDPDAGSLTGAALQWTSNINGSIGQGTSFSTAALSVGTHTITLTATDALGATDTDTVSITVNALPSANISTPSGNIVINAGSNQNFVGTASDPEDAIGALTITWTSDQDGQIGTGSSTNTSSLSANKTHVITFSVIDSNGARSTDTVNVRVNALPTASITAPSNGSNVTTGASVNFTSNGSDAEGAVAYAWTSNIDGQLSTNQNFSTTSLAVGTHTITLTITDSDGASASDSISINVSDPLNDAPVPNISGPADNLTIDLGTSLDFAGSASDTEDGTIPGASLAWSSSLDGAFGTGSTRNGISLSRGTHVITLTATDSDGASGTDTITVNVNGAPLASIDAPADNQSYLSGSVVAISGSGTDVEDGSLAAGNLSWSDGSNLGTGASINYSQPSGTYVITLTASDSRGLTDTDSITIHFNDAPSINITAPSDATNVASAVNVQFTATATDPEDGNVSANVVWTSSIDGAIGIGATVNTSTLSNGDHTITASITDSDNVQRTEAIQLSVGGAPSAQITGPSNNSVYVVGTNIDFSGTATDAKDGNLFGTQLQWTSSLDGSLGSGASVSTNTLTAGNHTITLTATDSDAYVDTASINIQIHNPPTVSITSPSNNATINGTTNILLQANANDAEDGALSGTSVQWTSSVNGLLGTGSSRTVSLNNGPHTITVTATDSLGVSASDSIDIFVNTAPTITITAPLDGANYTIGDQVSFVANANDSETTPSVSWSSDRDGNLGSGANFSTSSLSLGAHVITATADDGSLQAQDQISIQVFPAASVPETLTVVFRTNSNSGTYAPTNVAAAWIETQAGTFVKTIGRWSGERTYSLETWENASGGDVDAVMGATRSTHASQLTVTWNINNNISPDAIYNLRLEMTENDTYGEGPARIATISLNKNGVPQVQNNFTQNGFDIISFNYSGRPPVINSALTESAISSQPYTYIITASNGASTFSASGLPSGLSLDAASGVISGTPIGSGVFNVSISATNSAGTDTQTLDLTLDGTPIITSSLTAAGEQGTAFSYDIAALNSPTSFSASGLPSGLSINTGSGRISGAPSVAGSFVVNISATNADGTDTEQLDLTIGAPGLPVITSVLTATAEEGTAFNYTITATNNPTGFTATNLPPGLSLDTSTGVISGVPSSGDPATPVNVILNASNAGGSSPSVQLVLTVNYHPSVARDMVIRVLDPSNPVASDVQVEQNNTTVYSGLGQQTHQANGINKDQDSVISFPPGGAN